jgi:hypothetical protein
MLGQLLRRPRTSSNSYSIDTSTPGFSSVAAGSDRGPARARCLRLGQCSDGTVDLAALGMRSNQVHQQPAMPFRRETRSAGCLGGAQGTARVAQLDGHGDLEDVHVGRAELGVVVVAAGSEPIILAGSD